MGFQEFQVFQMFQEFQKFQEFQIFQIYWTIQNIRISGWHEKKQKEATITGRLMRVLIVFVVLCRYTRP